MVPHSRERIIQPPPPRSANLEAQAHMLAAADALFRTQDRVAGIIERRARRRDGALTATDVLRPVRRARYHDLVIAQLGAGFAEGLTIAQIAARLADSTADPEDLERRNELKKWAGELFSRVGRELEEGRHAGGDQGSGAPPPGPDGAVAGVADPAAAGVPVGVRRSGCAAPARH